MKYNYLKTTNKINSRFNLIQKIRMNVRPDWKFAVRNTDTETIIGADPPFTPTEEAALDIVMADPATVEDPPDVGVGNMLVIKDIFEYQDEAPFEISVFFAQSTPGTPPADEIHIIGWNSTFKAQRLLTSPQKNQLASWVEDLITGWE